MSRSRNLVLCAFLFALLAPATATADFIQVYANGHGSYLGGDENLNYFTNNDAGLGYGFTLGAEVLQVDVFLDANFHPAGSQWNQLGLGFDIDLIPGSLFVEPTGQLVYFFGKNEDSSLDSVKGLWARAGAQAGIEFATIFYFGAEGYAGYSVSLPDPEWGFVYIAGVFLGARLGF